MIEPLVIGDVFRAGARAAPHRTAAALGDRQLTFAEIDGWANRLARALLRLGVGHGARVAVWADTGLESVPLFAALSKLGAVFCPLNGRWGDDEAAATLDRLRPALSLVDGPRTAAGQALAQRLALDVMTLDALAEAGTVEPGDDVDVAVAETDPHVVFFTSGSSGSPKGAVLSHRANVLRSLPGALLEPRGSDGLPVPAVPHGGVDHRAPAVAGARRGGARVARRPPRRSARRSSGTGPPGSTASPPSGGASSTSSAALPGAPDLSTLRFADTGTSATPVELLPGHRAQRCPRRRCGCSTARPRPAA